MRLRCGTDGFLFSSLLLLSGSVFSVKAYLTSMKYMLLKGGRVPISGVTTVGPVFSGSVLRCAAECNKLSSLCNSFTVFQHEMLASQREAPADIGACQLMNFTDPHDVILGTATGNTRFFIADMCKNSGVCDVTRWPNICICPVGFGGTYCEKSKCKSVIFFIVS
jgi:hypothetical protein